MKGPYISAVSQKVMPMSAARVKTLSALSSSTSPTGKERRMAPKPMAETGVSPILRWGKMGPILKCILGFLRRKGRV